ncbi:protein kinase STUNTED isoform X1 [Physcomitrium patens]|uniref:Protein kinase domain-containing protein n=2 Tax=Physcomitrium patens TaxID=3218 RepID=A0A2K1KZT4_PHYPA|nr:uncharacterized protein LOC112278752 isoform X1 [Physcomitrium patens]PNR59288.1 hypothetical protein PHYPA_002079 [Physcomitrium patens]|eukprot:XP_024368233.1 uncharacterized protein LOC112278752 isoform X1 [Physcomitrella patens]
MDTNSVMDVGTYHHTMRCATRNGKKTIGVTGQYEEQESDGKRKKRKKALPEGRKIIVGMKLAASCREVLTWTIAKVAHPGDLVIALHVALFPAQSGSRGEEVCANQQQLATSLRNVLSVYEGLCTLKQIKLQLEIVNGTKARKTLVEEARTYDAYKLIMGTTRQHAAGWSASLGKYCIKRLPSTCSVIIVDQWKIMFDKRGTQLETSGPSMMKILRRSVKSFGRSRKVSIAVSCIDDDGTASTSSTPTTTEKKDGIVVDCDDRVSVHDSDCTSSSSSTMLHEGTTGSRSKSGSGSPNSVLPSNQIESALNDFEAFRLSYSKRRLEGSISKRTNSLRIERQNLQRLCGGEGDGDEDDSVEELDPYPTEVYNSDDNESRCSMPVFTEKTVAETMTPPEIEAGIQKGWPLVNHSFRDDKLSKTLISLETDEPVQRGWPLMHRSLSRENFNLPLGPTLDRSMSVVNWALQLPQRSGEFADRVSITNDLRKDGNYSTHMQSGREDQSYSAKVSVSFSLPHVRTRTMGRFEPDRLVSVTGRIHQLCRDRPRIYTYEELDAATSGFSPSNLIGIGGGSQVFRGTTSDGRLVAVKLLNQGRPQAQEELLTDIEINSSLKHRHIVPLLGYSVDAKHLILVYEFLPNGNLDDHLHGGKDSAVIPWEVRYRIAVGIAQALDYLHDGCPRPVVHRDVKASNILLTSTFGAQLSDFGLAKWAPTDTPFIRCNDVVGTFGYLAPEYFMYGRVNEKTDVYSFGVVLLELLTGRQPIDTTRPKGQENLVLWARPLLEEKNIDILADARLDGEFDVDELKSLMLSAALCIRHSAQRRPRMNTILKILSGEGESLGYWPRQGLINKSMDMEDASNNLVDGAADYGETDIRTHLALAMLGVDDGVDDESSFHDHDPNGMPAPHSSAYLEEYLKGRCSRSTSFNS